MHVEHSGFFVVDFAEIVAHALDAQPFALRVDHLPVGQIIQRRAPQYRLFAARVHRHIAAHAGSVGRSGIDGKHQPRLMRGLFYPPRYHARAAMDDGMLAVQTGQRHILHAAVQIEFFGVDHRAVGIQRHRSAGVTRAAAARNNHQIQFNQRPHQWRDFGFSIGVDHHKRIFHPPVGGVGNVCNPR